MDDEQHALSANLDHLWNRIALANADFHIAVTTTGMQPYTQGWTQCPGGASGGEAGRFFPVDNSRPRVLTSSTPNVKDVLFANTNVGLCHWDERFFDPVLAALTDPLINSTKAPGTLWPSDGNAGFLRDDARLALMVVSDADDDKAVPNPPPVSTQVQKLIAVKHGARDLISFSGIVALHNCPSSEGIGERYMEIAKELNGSLYDICDLNNFRPDAREGGGRPAHAADQLPALFAAAGPGGHRRHGERRVGDELELRPGAEPDRLSAQRGARAWVAHHRELPGGVPLTVTARSIRA
jgi:hypothetical protein